MPALDRHDDVFVLDIGDTENRFHPDWLASVNDLLDEVENAEGPRALVTAATGKFFSNGLDLDWLSAHPGDASQYVTAVHELLARVLALPVITVAVHISSRAAARLDVDGHLALVAALAPVDPGQVHHPVHGLVRQLGGEFGVGAKQHGDKTRAQVLQLAIDRLLR